MQNGRGRSEESESEMKRLGLLARQAGRLFHAETGWGFLSTTKIGGNLRTVEAD